MNGGSIANAPCEPESSVPEHVRSEREIVFTAARGRERVRCSGCAAHIRYVEDGVEDSDEDEWCNECEELGRDQ